MTKIFSKLRTKTSSKARRFQFTVSLDGAAAANDLLMQFQSDILDVRILRPEQLENTALGAAFMAGLGVGFWKDQESLDVLWKSQKVFKACMDEKTAKKLKERWDRALDLSLHWSK